MATFFARNFSFLRAEREISQTAMGDLLGLTRASVDAYEDGRAMPPFEKLKKIADYFNLSIETITEDDLSESPLEQEIKRIEKIEEESDSPEIKEEESEYKFEEELSNLNIKANSDSGIPLIQKKNFQAYLSGIPKHLLTNAPRVFFNLPEISNYRAFETSGDFPCEDSVLIGVPLNKVSAAKDGERYLIISQKGGFQYRRVYNQAKLKGSLILSGEVPGIAISEIRVGDIKEIWEVKAFMSTSLPEPKSDATEALKLVQKLKKELKRLI
ncbi:MAG: transcriptional regulator with XRE-family HTH domain [Arcticibacterium sp.]|jgi:transcriptional regulator with XRE-family HTH domain